MAGLETLILPALIPVITDVVKSTAAWLTNGAGAKPQTVDEEIRLMQAKAEWMKGMAELDRPSGETSKWVNDTRASFRYLAASVIILNAIVAGWVLNVSIEYQEMSWSYAGSAFAFVFGDRVLLGLKRK